MSYPFTGSWIETGFHALIKQIMSLPAAGTSTSFVNDVFPFHFAIDDRLLLTQVGRSLAKFSDEFVAGRGLTELFRIESPGTELTWADLEAMVGSRCELNVRHKSLKLRGQLVRQGDELVFLGSPCFETLDEVKRAGLTEQDFAVHDGTMATLQAKEKLQRQLATTSEELRRLRRADSDMLEERLDYESCRDPVTGLLNRRGMKRELEAELSAEKPFALVFIDLDDFKRVNDGYGHEAGDELLQQVGANLQANIRRSDTASRLGGDEFAVLLRDVTEAEQAIGISQRLMQSAYLGIRIAGNELHISGSVGIALSTPHDTAIDMFRNADLAMYDAKTAERGTTSVYRSEMAEALCAKVKTQRELEAGIPREEIIPHYQSIVALEDQRIVGVEALARWQHPERGVLSPASFIDIAEETGLIGDLGKRLLYRACTEVHARNQQRERPWTVNVNLSPRQLQESEIVELVSGALEATELPPELLKLEITETTLFADVSQAAKVFKALKALGVRVALDDFGIGYSSMQYLRRFPIDVLKVDRSFVAQIDQPEGNPKLVESIVTFGLSMGLEVVAEGIERPRQVELLRSMGCPCGQGFYFSKPMALSQIEESSPSGGGQSTPGAPAGPSLDAPLSPA